jgi:hypothetical protein
MARWTIPVQLSVSVGVPALTGRVVRVACSDVPTTSEGQLIWQRGTAVSESITRFSLDSLVADRFSWNTALSLALASQLSYDNPQTVTDVALNLWRLQSCQFIEADDTQCFVASSADAAFVAFRGTESLGDWLGNLNTISTTRSYGRVHRGFLGAFEVVDLRLRAALTRLDRPEILLTGHSLGGALATVAAAEWQGHLPISWIYSFGQPAVGKGSFRSFFDQHYAGKFIRFVNDDDIIARVPPTFHHVGSLFHFDAAGDLQNGPGLLDLEAATGGALPGTSASAGPPMLTEVQFDHLRAQLLDRRAQSRMSGFESLSRPELEGLFPSVSDHSLDTYIAKIAAKAAI